MSWLRVLAICLSPNPFCLGADDKPKPGKDGTTTWNACFPSPTAVYGVTPYVEASGYLTDHCWHFSTRIELSQTLSMWTLMDLTVWAGDGPSCLVSNIADRTAVRATCRQPTCLQSSCCSVPSVIHGFRKKVPIAILTAAMPKRRRW